MYQRVRTEFSVLLYQYHIILLPQIRQPPITDSGSMGLLMKGRVEGRTVRVLKMVLMAVAALTEAVLTSRRFEGRFKGVSIRHLRSVYPTDSLNFNSLRYALKVLRDFGHLEMVEVAGEKYGRWIPTGFGKKTAEGMVFEDRRLPLYYEFYCNTQLTDTNVTYERLRDIVSRKIQLVIREDDFWK
jgi:hypothetical protein